MIALADQTSLTWATESTWGTPATSGFKTLPISNENLTGIRRHIRPQLLTANRRGTAILPLEESSSGEIDMLASPSLLPQLLASVLMNSQASQTASNVARTGQTNNILLPKAMADVVTGDDYLWLTDPNDTSKTGWVRFTADNAKPKEGVVANATTAKITPSATASLALQRLIPGATAKPMTINKRYGNGQEWQQFTGMLMRRLELASHVDSLLTATASFAGKQTAIKTTGFPTSTAYDNTQPYSLAASSVQIRLLSDSEILSLNASNNNGMATTALRLVIEYPTMQPRFALGSLYPQAMLIGDMHVHGLIEVMVDGHTISKWFGARQAVTMECAMEFANGGGFAFRIPRMRIAETSNNVLLAGEPVRQVLRFDADPATDSNIPLIACYFA